MPNIAQDLITIESILKEEYLDFVRNNLNVTPTPFLEMIKKETLTANSGKFGSRTGIGGGFGMGAEREKTPSAYAPLYGKFDYTSKDAYVDIQISHKDIVLGQSDKSAMINTVQDAMDASYEAANWNVGRMVFGDSTGKLCNVSGVTTGSPEITVDDTTFLIEGLVVDLFPATTKVYTTPSTASVQIVAIDHANKKVILSKNPSEALSAGIMAVQNSLGREITGLKSIFDSSVETVYGVNKADNPWVLPHTIDANHDIDDTKITDAVSFARDRRNAKIDLIMAGEDAFRAYEYYMKEGAKNVTVVDKRKFVGGAVGYTVLAGNQEVTIVRERFVPKGSMWGVDTSKFALRETGWDFAAHNGSIFVLREDTSVYRALLANYMELICKMPGGCIELTNCGIA
jgi:hypothetical protein